MKFKIPAKRFDIKKYFETKKIALLTNIDKTPIHLFLKKLFRSYEIVFDKDSEWLGDIHSFPFFEIQLYQYGIHLSSTHEKNDLVIAVVVYPFEDKHGNTIDTLSVLIAKEGKVKKETRIIEKCSKEELRFLTIKTLQDLYEELKNPHAF